MEKQISKDGKIWFRTQDKGNTEIGFTRTTIDRVLTECWHILPATSSKVKINSPVLCMETNDGMFSITSPCAGDIISFNDKAMNFPDQLNEEDVILVVGVKPTVAPIKKGPVKKVINPHNMGDRLFLNEALQPAAVRVGLGNAAPLIPPVLPDNLGLVEQNDAFAQLQRALRNHVNLNLPDVPLVRAPIRNGQP